MSVQEFALPDVGEGLTEAEILAWHVAVGDTVSVNQIIVDIETSKAAVELPCPFAGTVTELLADVGETVAVGSPLIRVSSGAAESEGSGDVLVGYGTRESAKNGRRRRRAASPPAQPSTSGRVRATPPVRKMAKELGIDLSQVTATGDRVTRADVERHVAEPVGSPPLQDERVPIRGVRKATAEAMTRSAFTAPHVTAFLSVDVTRTMKCIDRLASHPAFDGVRVTPLLFVARALLSAIRRHPEINASWDEDAGEIVYKRQINLGIAAATSRGLIVPNIKDAAGLTLPQLAHALSDLVADARSGKTTPAAMSKGTVTITNIGVFGVDAATPILNPGEAAILCVGAIRRIPWEHKGKVALRQVTQLSLSFDHRLVDGELGSKVLARVGAVLADPKTELLLD